MEEPEITLRGADWTKAGRGGATILTAASEHFVPKAIVFRVPDIEGAYVEVLRLESDGGVFVNSQFAVRDRDTYKRLVQWVRSTCVTFGAPTGNGGEGSARPLDEWDRETTSYLFSTGRGNPPGDLVFRAANESRHRLCFGGETRKWTTCPLSEISAPAPIELDEPIHVYAAFAGWVLDAHERHFGKSPSTELVDGDGGGLKKDAALEVLDRAWEQRCDGYDPWPDNTEVNNANDGPHDATAKHVFDLVRDALAAAYDD